MWQIERKKQMHKAWSLNDICSKTTGKKTTTENNDLEFTFLKVSYPNLAKLWFLIITFQ